MRDHPTGRIRSPASLGNLRSLLKFIDECGDRIGLDDRSRQQVELAADEMLTNIIQYAYPEGEGEISVSCSIDPLDRFSVEIVDGGPPLNPVAEETPTLQAGIEERRIGGLGILLARREVDEMTYRREGSRNVLTMYKKRSPRP